MSADSRFDISDLSRQAKEAKRDHDQKHKWAYGGRPLPGRRWETGFEMDRPRLPVTHTKASKAWNQSSFNKHAAGARQAFRLDVADELIHPSDSSADEEVREASAVPDYDADIIYSYDAPTGPARGSQILSIALTRAVERFETRETEKLVNNEYEVICKEDEQHGDGYTADEDDDFELV